jgi:hypothetical protein
MNPTDSIHIIHYITVAFGFLLLYFVTVLKALMLEDFRPYDHVRYHKLADLTGDHYKGFKKVILAINYERRRMVVDSILSFGSLAIGVLAYIVLILMYAMFGRLATLRDLSVSIIPIVVSACVSLVVLHLKSLEKQIKKP